MKKSLLVYLFVTGIVFLTQAQEVGLRVGNTAIDAVFPTSEYSRIHTDVSIDIDSIYLDALYDFSFRKLGTKGFYWYTGIGPSAIINNPMCFGISGEIGAEYRLSDVPLSLSFDWRPVLWLTDNSSLRAYRFGFNMRYVFKKSRN
jgi:hypothetical protein